MAKNRAQISLFGDSEISREGLKHLLVEAGFETRCQALADIEAAAADLKDDRDHLILIDVQSPKAGLTACSLIREHKAFARIVLISSGYDGAAVRDALALGADGFLLRAVSYEPLVLMLQLVCAGQKIVPTQFVDDFASAKPGVGARSWENLEEHSNLSDREIATLRGLVDGASNKMIARTLGIAEATVKVHVKAILRKLNVANRTQAAIWVVHRGLIGPQAITP
jgi:two-component system nitrate/nitrite response regulator NarL